MARFVLIASLLLSVMLALYLPTRYPAERFLAHLRAEHQLAMGCWGERIAWKILERAISGMDHMKDSVTTTKAGVPDAPVEQALVEVGGRVLRSSYARSLEALLAVATYRSVSLFEWLPWLAPLGLALALDGGAVRTVRSREFVQHDPEWYGLFMTAAAGLVGATLAGLVLPVTLNPMVVPALVAAILVVLSRAIASFHRAG